MARQEGLKFNLRARPYESGFTWSVAQIRRSNRLRRLRRVVMGKLCNTLYIRRISVPDFMSARGRNLPGRRKIGVDQSIWHTSPPALNRASSRGGILYREFSIVFFLSSPVFFVKCRKTDQNRGSRGKIYLFIKMYHIALCVAFKHSFHGILPAFHAL